MMNPTEKQIERAEKNEIRRLENIVKRLSFATCADAYTLARIDGQGEFTIARTLEISATDAIDAIAAGTWLSEGEVYIG